MRTAAAITAMLVALGQQASALPRASTATCDSLASAKLGPNITVLSAEITNATSALTAPPAPAPSCTFVPNTDNGDSSSVIREIKGLTDEAACCKACYAEPRCGVAAILPKGSWSPGCWLKTGAGAQQKKAGVTLCRTHGKPLPPPSPPPIQYCLVKVLVQPAINIWVGLPLGGAW